MFCLFLSKRSNNKFLFSPIGEWMLKCCFCGLTRIFFYWSLNYLPLQTSPAPNETWEKAENNILTKKSSHSPSLAFHWDNFQLSLSNNSCSWNECILLPWGSSKTTTATRIWKQECFQIVPHTENFDFWTSLRILTVIQDFFWTKSRFCLDHFFVQKF